MSDILIVGGGFAGVWSAMAAARLCHQRGRKLTISLVAPGDDLVIRPRLYEPGPGAMRVPRKRVLDPIGVARVNAVATAVHPGRRSVTVVGHGRTRELAYRRLVLATGSVLKRPDLPGAEYLHDVDTLTGAIALDTHLRALPARPPGAGRFTAVVVGAGFTGLEVATELVSRLRALAGPAGQQVRVVLVDRADTVGPELGPGPRPVIGAALRELGIEVRLGVSLAAVDAAHLRLTDGTGIAAHTVVWTAGMTASPLTRQLRGRHDRLGRLAVDRHLRVPQTPEVFATGDAARADAEAGQVTIQSCQHAIPLGRYAGHNAAADLLGHPAAEFCPEPYETCLDLGAAGAVFTTGWERAVRLTGEPAKERKRRINQRAIYPPPDDAAAILAEGDLARTWADVA
jgi:NADH:ubiquinone reductase (H+-translocating)